MIRYKKSKSEELRKTGRQRKYFFDTDLDYKRSMNIKTTLKGIHMEPLLTTSASSAMDVSV